MRCEVKEEGRSYKRWEYVLELDKPFRQQTFVSSLNSAIEGLEKYGGYLISSRKTGCYLTHRKHKDKIYAELDFSVVDDSRKVIMAVTRRDIGRRSLSELLSSVFGNNLNQQESQPCPDRQLDLFQLG